MPQDRDGATYTHGMADIEARLRLHYVTAGEGERTVVLLHGFPQTWWAWHRVIPTLVDAGFRVVAPDYRGAGQSWRPLGGYDKRTMAEDIHRLMRRHLEIEDSIAVVGHDIGLMVAFAYAEAHRNEVSHLVVMDAPLPGTAVVRSVGDPRGRSRHLHVRIRRAGRDARRVATRIPQLIVAKFTLPPHTWRHSTTFSECTKLCAILCSLRPSHCCHSGA
jgi:pimeloyl-ACP methyl ester carboxylesterase